MSKNHMKNYMKRQAHIDAFLKSPRKEEIIIEADPAMIDGLHSMMILSLDKMNDENPHKLKKVMKHHAHDVSNMIGAKSLNKKKKHMINAELQGKGFWNSIGNFFTKTIPHGFDVVRHGINDFSDTVLDPHAAAKIGEAGLKKIGVDLPIEKGLDAIIKAVPDNRLASVKAQASY